MKLNMSSPLQEKKLHERSLQSRIIIVDEAYAKDSVAGAYGFQSNHETSLVCGSMPRFKSAGRALISVAISLRTTSDCFSPLRGEPCNVQWGEI